MRARLVVLASGAGTNLQAIVDACESGRLEAEVVLVVVNRRHAAAADRARAARIRWEFWPLSPYRERILDPASARQAYDSDLSVLVDSMDPDLVVQCGWMHLFSTAFLNQFPGQVLNLHPALPGQFPGPNAIDEAWAAHRSCGLDRTGVMVHLVPDEGVDDGPVLACEEVAIHDVDTRASLESRVHEVEHRLIVETLSECIGQL